MKTDLELAVEIATGLLASGHYTFEQHGEPIIKRWELDEWKACGQRANCMAHVVDDAFDILEEIRLEHGIRAEGTAIKPDRPIKKSHNTKANRQPAANIPSARRAATDKPSAAPRKRPRHR